MRTVTAAGLPLTAKPSRFTHGGEGRASTHAQCVERARLAPEQIAGKLIEQDEERQGASQMEDALCGLRPICGNQILFLNGRSVLMMLMLVSPVPSEFAWAITFGRCIARF